MAMSPVSAEGSGGSCGYMNQQCFFTELQGAPPCQAGTEFQCRCPGGGEPFVCSCCGAGKEADEVEAEGVEIGDPEDESGAFAAPLASSLVLSGAIAAFAVGL